MDRRMFLACVPAAALRGTERPFYSDKQDLLYYLDASGQRHAVRSKKDWHIRRAHVLEGMQQVMGALPAKVSSAPAVTVVEEHAEERYVRRKIRYEAETGDWVPAWLLLPKAKGRRPAVVCCHQTTRIGKDEPVGLGGKPNLRYAQELAERGFVTIAADYPNFGEYTMDVYAKGYVSASMKGIVNHMRAVDLLQSMAEVDARKIGVCGHSLGGHNSLFLAAFDTRVKCAVTSCGFNSFPKYFGGNITGWSHKGYMPRIAEVYGKDPKKMPFDFPEVLGAIAPRGLFINAPKRDSNFEVSGVEDCVASARPVYEKIFHHKERLVVEYPDAEHDFPVETRHRGYAFLERMLR